MECKCEIHLVFYRLSIKNTKYLLSRASEWHSALKLLTLGFDLCHDLRVVTGILALGSMFSVESA